MQDNAVMDNRIRSAYSACLQQARTHYENFPTASRLVEKRHRDATAAIYSFARRADDIADEGDATDSQRHSDLNTFSSMLADIAANKTVEDTTFIALADTIYKYHLPILPFEKLLTAFKMDVDKNRFNNFDELLFYCQHSANPVGELILRLHDRYNKTTQALSDSICSALQLINFLQDIHDDFQQRNRIYIPLDEMNEFGIDETSIKQKINSENLQQLVNFQLQRATNMLVAGAPLLNHLQGQIKWVIKLTLVSGLLVCEKLAMRTNVFARPSLSKLDWLKIATRSIYFRPDRTHAKISSTIKSRSSR